ncbi:SDR family NAD(P)-dependent oxidoreductase [Symbioplanes lichenis]|uniref:SDR family NAD(P)-dependent oxidoreductase n=1 Tax=Symbioplanes lichenis TaxID=1629072 RepID=UPI002738AB55|nr:SDR family oxidoreductase [Actinoplanes lichenis]
MTPAPGARRVLVTGASRGIGRAIAVAFAARGDRVAVHYATARTDAEETLALLAGAGPASAGGGHRPAGDPAADSGPGPALVGGSGDGARHALVGGDVGDPDAAAGIVAAAVAALGGVDVLVNNAAVAPGDDTVHRVAEVGYAEWQRVWRRMIDVDLLGAANLTWCVARHLIERGAPGSIVNVGSRGAFRGEPDFPAYGAAKAGLHAFGQSMAVALAPHRIAVTSVAPGFIGTDRQNEKLAGPGGEAVLAQSPFGRVGTPEEVAEAVLWLSSPEATWSSGTVLDLNGASYLRT